MNDAQTWFSVLEWTALTLALLILICSIDDAFIDACYWWRRIHRHRRTAAVYRTLTGHELSTTPEKSLAILVPAWQEQDVIASMLDNLCSVLQYRNYRVFVGTYPNDPRTIEEVEQVCLRHAQVTRVEVPHPGPTSKADCLNHLVQAVHAFESAAGEDFAGVILHDCEDVLHPLELKFFNHLLPRKDMIQLPVASLERDLGALVAGTYMDEFAESHAKQMVVRETLAKAVPSAGVGTCLSARALRALAAAGGGQPFNTASLTEDYDLGMRLAELGLPSIFATFNVAYELHRDGRACTVSMPLCVREFFPDSFRAAYRQKARWVMGICLQSWQQIRLQGRSPGECYLLLHDRKGVVTNFLALGAYLLLLAFVVMQLGAWAGWWSAQEPTLFAEGEPARWLLYANGFFLLNRTFHRIYFTTGLYGWRHGLMSVPRMFVGNIINCAAVARAWRLYLAHLLLGRRLVWDKTAHSFPSASQLARG